MSNFSLINNLSSLSAQSKLGATSGKLNQTLQRLSSGLRINKSGDDAAGLAIANSLRSDISVLSQGVRNANDGLSALQIVDGGLNTISGLLDRASSLAAQSASGTFTGNRDTLQNELSKVTEEITRQAKNIGLAGGGGADSRLNKAVSVFIGGGVDASGSTNTVSIDLSGSKNQVDAAGLGLASINIGATAIATSATKATAANAVGLNTSTVATQANAISTTANSTKVSGGTLTGAAVPGSEAIVSDETLTFSDGTNTFSVNLSAGDKGQAIADKINAAATGANAFASASYDATTKKVTLDAGSTPSASYTVDSNRAANDAQQTGFKGATVTYNSGTSTSTPVSGNTLAGPATIEADEQLTFTGADGKVFSINLTGGKTGAEVAAAINSDSANQFVKASFDGVTGKLSLEANQDSGKTPQSFTVASNRSASDTKQTGLNGAAVSFTKANTIAADEKLTFHVGSQQFDVDLTRGDSVDDIVTKINNSAASAQGIVASKNTSTGKLEISSDLTKANGSSFTITSNRTASASSSGLNNVSSTFTKATKTADETLTFKIGSNSVDVALKTGDTTDQVLSKINAAVGQYGIQAKVGSGSNAALNTVELSVDISNPNAADFTVDSTLANAASGSLGLKGAAVTITKASGGETGAVAALDAIKAAVATLGQIQGAVGAGQNNISQAIDLASTQITNFQAAESSIRDADIASEASNLARLNTLQQAGVSALAQANQSSQALLSLLR